MEVFLLQITNIALKFDCSRIVVDTMKDLDGDRKCFQLVGGVLCERTVKDVLPQLQLKKDSVSSLSCFNIVFCSGISFTYNTVFFIPAH